MWPCGGVVSDHADEVGLAELCIGEVRAEKYCPAEVSPGQVRSAEVSTRQVGLA